LKPVLSHFDSGRAIAWPYITAVVQCDQPDRLTTTITISRLIVFCGDGGDIMVSSITSVITNGAKHMSDPLFFIGQCIHHNKFDYRGVIFDVDAEFEGTDEWYEQVAKSHPPKDKPWYYVLVDGGPHTTYVAERNLEPDATGLPIQHQGVNQFFESFKDGIYKIRRTQ
jgi:heat shock protein HspQ